MTKLKKQYYVGKKEQHEEIYRSKKREPVWTKDPSEEMQKLRWIVRTPSKGKWMYMPQITAIFKAMEEIAVKEILLPLGFTEMISSNIVSAEEVWMHTGHLEGMPMEIYYVQEPVSRDPAVWETFIDKLKITKKIPYEELSKLLQSKPLQGLTYAQCPIIYWSFKKKQIAKESLPLLLFERKSNSFRYESGGRHGIERVDEFHRIEPMFMGTPEQVLKLRDEFLEKYTHVFDNILELEWRTAKVRPFYQQQSGDFKEEDADKGTIDFETWLPFRGSREKSEWLEFQNLSVLGEKYAKAFQIKGQGHPLWSGCSGIGLQRWVVSFLAQKGLDPKKWPKGFRKYLDKLPKDIVLY